MARSAENPLFDVRGRVACVTGASSGLGRAAATMLAGSGARVVGVARRHRELQDWADQAGKSARALVADLSDRGGLAEVARLASEPFGPPEILVNAAGINPRQTADEVTLEGWNLSLDLNLAAPFFLAQALVPAMKSRGWGRIINFASLQSRRAFPGGLSYGAAKGGVDQLTRAMAEAWSREGITVNALAPGFFETELTAPLFRDPETAQRLAAQTCIGRNGRLSDLEGPLLFFCSQASAYITGQTLFIDGGFTAK